MDALVARYSRPTLHAESYPADEDRQLLRTKPNLSLRFQLPPIANVRFGDWRVELAGCVVRC